MKKFKYVFCLLFILLSTVQSCDERKFLEEIPLSFFSLENSYHTAGDYERALTDLYARVREICFGSGASINYFVHFQATDIAKHARGDADRFGDYDVWLVPTNSMVAFHWENWYKIISNANTVLSRLNASELTDDQKNTVAAEAKLFRAFAYRHLVYLFGGVPLILEEITAPKTDFVRATESAVLEQIVADLVDAEEHLPEINQVVDGKVSKSVANHFLAETYLSLQQYDQAIAAAEKVINNPATRLMTSRFGRRSSETPGDVYWDLFQRDNQNRSSGNLEAIWVAQMELDIPGGLLVASGGSANSLERFAVPAGWTLLDPEGRNGMNGQGMSDYNMGGRGVSFMMNTDYYLYTVWESDWNNDIRNAPHNIVRDVIYNEPSSAWYGMSAVEHPSLNWLNQKWRWYPWPTKLTTPGDHPDEAYEDKDNLILKAGAGSTYRDMYILRLAETFLLRAEVYLRKGDLISAANDINIVRQRSNASAILPGEVTLDYLLDERARELVYEEQRRITLHRTNTLVERVRRYNDLNGDEIKDFHARWPIPFSEIEANKDAVITQNPGYN